MTVGQHSGLLERLAAAKAAQDAEMRAEAEQVVARISETVRQQHGRRTLEQIVRQAGFSESWFGDLDAVVRLNDGRCFR